jgi:hypothetical protein
MRLLQFRRIGSQDVRDLFGNDQTVPLFGRSVTLNTSILKNQQDILSIDERNIL